MDGACIALGIYWGLELIAKAIEKCWGKDKEEDEG